MSKAQPKLQPIPGADPTQVDSKRYQVALENDAEGQGIVTTKNCETAMWKGNGVGRPTGRGSGVGWRGAVYYQSSSERLQRLNRVAGIFEYETDENGNTCGKVYKWR